MLSLPSAIFRCNTFAISRNLKVTAPKMLCRANFRNHDVEISVGFLVAKVVMVRGSWPCIYDVPFSCYLRSSSLFLGNEKVSAHASIDTCPHRQSCKFKT